MVNHELYDLQTLDPQAQPAGNARIRAVCHGKGLDILASPACMQEAPTSAGRGGQDARDGAWGMQVFIPIRTVSALNAREHWRTRARRVKTERNATWLALLGKNNPAMPCTVKLTRLGPSNGLDEGDNLASAFKGIRDQIADWMGINDRDPRVKWEYAQRREKQWGVLVEFLETLQ